MNHSGSARVSAFPHRAAELRGLIPLAALLLTLALASRGDAFLGILTQLAGTAGCVSETGTSASCVELDSQAGCISDDGSGGLCVDGKALGGAVSVALSADDKHVYVASVTSDAVAVFARAK